LKAVVFMLERSFAMVFKAVESASSPVSGIEKLAMVHLLVECNVVAPGRVPGG
jgi:hypothetical protein